MIIKNISVLCEDSACFNFVEDKSKISSFCIHRKRIHNGDFCPSTDIKDIRPKTFLLLVAHQYYRFPVQPYMD